MNEPITAAVRLVVTPDLKKPGRFTARLDGTEELIIPSSRQPLVDGARELLARGFDPVTPLTMRHQGSTCDSFKAAPIGQWAKWTFTESDRDGLRRARWIAPELHEKAQKSGAKPPGVRESHPTEIRFYDGPPYDHSGASWGDS